MDDILIGGGIFAGPVGRDRQTIFRRGETAWSGDGSSGVR
jgi:hypothetical protein